jgi:hypothetical protein
MGLPPYHYNVAMMSMKVLAALKMDIRCILDHMQVQYRERKTGFDCIHLLSIDISLLQDAHGTLTPSSRKHHKQSLAGSGNSGSTTRQIVHKEKELPG